MKTAWVTERKTISILEKENEPPLGDEVVVKVRACGICGTDLHFFNDFPGKKPIPLGHEVSGTVHETGSGAGGLSRGDAVIVQNHVPCGSCFSCLQGKSYSCSNIQTYMNDRAAMAEFLKVRRNMVLPYQGLQFEEAAIAEPLTVALDLMREAKVEPFQDVCVSGPGIIGLMCARLTRLSGAAEIAVLGRRMDEARGRHRAEAARLMGATAVFDTEANDWKEKLRERFPGGFQRIIVTSPPKTIAPIIDFASFAGVIVYNGISFREENVSFNANTFHFKKLKLLASHAIPNWGFPLAFDLLRQKKLDYKALVTHVYPFEELERAFATAASSEESVIKVVVSFDR